MTELIIQTGKHQGKKIDLSGQDCIIGRHESCKIRIASGDVSKQHCRLKHKPNGLNVKDLGSRNGTFLNDQQITEETVVQPGDLLRVGPMTFLVSPGKEAGEKTDAKTKKPSKQAGAQPAGDDLIAAWLSEGGDIEKSGQDTTVIASPVDLQSSEPTARDSSSASGRSSAASTSQASNLQSVKERAQNIIKRWQKEHGKG